MSIFTVGVRRRAFERRFKIMIRRGRKGKGRGRGRRKKRNGVMGGVEGMGEGEVSEKMDEGRREPVGEREFENRHSGPRDPTSLRDQGEGGEESMTVTEQLFGSSPVFGDGDGDGNAGKQKEEEISPTAKKSPGQKSTSFAPPPPLSRLTHRHPHPHPSSEDQDQEPKSAPLQHGQYPHYLTRHTTGRNAQFYNLTRAEREHLGGVEYRAITLLSWIVPTYFVLWQVLAGLGLGAYMASHKASVAEENGINPWLVTFFHLEGGVC